MSDKVMVEDKAPATAEDKAEKYENAASKDSAEELRTVRFSPRADILETKEDFFLHIDMPGVKKEDAKVDFEEGVITVQGRAECLDRNSCCLQHRAYDVKEYYRSFQLTEGIDLRKIEAKMQDGVLSVTLPKAEEARPRQILVAS